MNDDIKCLCRHGLVVVALWVVLRVVFVVGFVPADVLASEMQVLPRLLFNVARFDLQVAAYALLLPTLLMLVSCFLPRQSAWKRHFRQFRKWYFVTVYMLVVLLGGIDLGFYSNFHSHINLVFFDFFHEGPLGLLQTVWEEYHVGWYLLMLVVLGFLSVWVAGRIERVAPARGGRPCWLLMVGYLVALTVCLRGSVWRFPLQIEDTFVSDNKLINDIVPNAAYMLKKAYKEKKNTFQPKSVETLLAHYQFDSLQQALDVYTGGKVRMQANDTLQALQTALFETVPDTARGVQPNVVVIYGESWSNYLFELDSKSTDMYMGLRRHFKEDLLFRHFQSVQNGTIASIENLTVGAPFPRLFASKYRLRPLPTSMAVPFNQSGYLTEFLSGMDMAWENSAEALTHQQFRLVSDKFRILKDNPKAAYNSIGVYDEYLFAYLLKQLCQKATRPRMITVMTTTNHPPFEFPAHLQLPPVDAAVYNAPCFAEKSQKVLDKYLTGFRYFNYHLCRFLDRFKASPAARNTILVITGDHNVRSILDYNVVDRHWQYSVPLYIYLPPAWRKKVYRSLTDRWGCHDDIVPTLAPLAFRHTRYFKLGNNLLDTAHTAPPFYSYNIEQLLADEKDMPAASRRVAARNLLREVYFQTVLLH